MSLWKPCSALLLTVSMLLVWTSRPLAHCEMPCGIYNDHMRIEMMQENIATIEKAMNMITQLSAETPVNYNQLVRWVGTKDEHADEFQHTVSQYFMTQRVKPADPKDEAAYKLSVEELTCLHKMLVYAMKCKQTIDPENVKMLRSLVDTFSGLYFTESDKQHMMEHH
jgi:nickel superoxide dismutase